MQHPLRTRLVDCRQLGFTAVISTCVALLVPYQVTPQFTVTVFPHYGIHALYEVVPGAVLNGRRFPIIIAKLCKAHHRGRVNVLLKGAVTAVALYARTFVVVMMIASLLFVRFRVGSGLDSGAGLPIPFLG